jgi:chlorobactene glucosyltransferase
MEWFLLFPLVVWTLFTCWNALLFRQLRHFVWRPLPDHLPTVSLLVPARNEAENLPTLIPSLLAQDYPKLEIIILSDHSSDQTLAIAKAYAAEDPRLRVLEGGELLPGWMGKQNACRQLAEAASGEILLFSDADTNWQPDAVSLIIKAFHHQRLDGLSAWPEQLLVGPLSHLTQPFMCWSLLALLPVPLIPNPRFPGIVSANGQLIAFTRECFEDFGGFEVAKSSILDDMALARAVKRAGRRFSLLGAVGSIRCRMYGSDREVFDGFARAAFVNLGGSPLALIAVAAALSWLFVGPWLWLLTAMINSDSWLLPALALLLSLTGRAVSDAVFGFSTSFGLLQAPSVAAWVTIALASWYRYATGQIAWKGRVYDLRPNAQAKPPAPNP